MSDPNFVQLNTPSSSGAKIATFQVTNGEAEVVQLQAVALLHAEGDEVSAAKPIPVSTTVEEKELYAIAGLVSYKGMAPRGSTTDAAVWRIRRFEVDGAGNPVSTTWATGVAWDDRATATYT